MAAYVIVDIEVLDPVRYEEYRRLVPPTIARYGGSYLVRGGAAEVLEGAAPIHRLVVLEFESVERAKAWWASPEYAAVKGLREASARTISVLVQGV